MTCRKAKKAIPLLAGGDLAPRNERKVRAHIDICPSCRQELEEYRCALGRAKASAREEKPGDWSESEWKALMTRITVEKMEKKSTVLELRARWALASGMAAVIILAVTVLFVKDTAFGPQETSSIPGSDVVSVTMVSRESGLQVVWFFNKNFEWKGDKN
jgi:anti-sigma factor RsiW